jgi:hypothetical protein
LKQIVGKAMPSAVISFNDTKRWKRKKKLSQPIKKTRNLKTAAEISLVVLLLSIVGQLIAVYQTRYQLVSPLIPESAIWEICKQFIFTALISAIVSIIGLIFYFFEKYLWIIILVALTLVSERYIYI